VLKKNNIYDVSPQLNLLYKKIVSNYKILLDDNLTNDDCDKLVINTAATLEVCMQELFKAH